MPRTSLNILEKYFFFSKAQFPCCFSCFLIPIQVSFFHNLQLLLPGWKKEKKSLRQVTFWFWLSLVLKNINNYYFKKIISQKSIRVCFNFSHFFYSFKMLSFFLQTQNTQNKHLFPMLFWWLIYIYILIFTISKRLLFFKLFHRFARFSFSMPLRYNFRFYALEHIQWCFISVYNQGNFLHF